MKKIFFLFPFCLILSFAIAQNASNQISIIPEPVLLANKSGEFLFPKTIFINTSSIPAIENVTDGLIKKLKTAAGISVLAGNAANANIDFIISKTYDSVIGKEGYRLSVASKKITIKANETAGLFYGVQTLLQLLPPQIESNNLVKGIKWTIPCVEITDYPRFGWRGLMLDVSRHFFTKEEVEKFIDEMSRYKFNLFHWHLSDDEGWRIEIKSLPLLTQVGAWNAKRTGHFGDFSPIKDDEPRNYGGFYTQDDIKEVVAYAAKRFINVMPEIDMPGHSLATIASYPELSCTDGADKYKVASGEEIMVWPDTGHFYGLVDNTLCPANEKVYPFIDKVMTELAQLFPFEYIHIGGDECARNFWEKSDAIKELMEKENLKTIPEVQGYFEKRVEKIVESKGKKAIGWDEILEGGLAPNTAVMSWRGIDGGIAAAALQHQVVMSPTTFCYLDYMQSDDIMEPHVYESLRLSKSYKFEPLPPGVDAKYIKGGQGNLWTEQVYNFRQAEYMIWPRALAISETVWSPAANKNWEHFVKKTEEQFRRFDMAEIKYCPGMYDPDFAVSTNEKGDIVVTLSTEINGLDIYYSFDNSYPDKYYPKYTAPLVVPQDATLLRVITYRNGKPIGRMNNMPVAELKKRLKKLI